MFFKNKAFSPNFRILRQEFFSEKNFEIIFRQPKNYEMPISSTTPAHPCNDTSVTYRWCFDIVR